MVGIIWAVLGVTPPVCKVRSRKSLIALWIQQEMTLDDNDAPSEGRRYLTCSVVQRPGPALGTACEEALHAEAAWGHSVSPPPGTWLLPSHCEASHPTLTRLQARPHNPKLHLPSPQPTGRISS